MTYTATVEDLALKLKLAADAQLEGSVDQLSSAWKRAWAEVEREWQEATLDLANAAEDGVWPTRAQIARSAKAQAALDSTGTQISSMTNVVLNSMDAMDILSLTNQARSHQEQLLRAQMPEGYQMPQQRYDPRMTQSIVSRTVQQITVKHWPLSDEATSAMKSALIRGIAVGDNPRTAAADMMKRVEGAFNGGRARAENIARTEMMDAVRDAGKQAQDAMSDVLQGWRWVAGLSERTCPACLSMHGQVFPLDEPGPQGHPSCRCGRAPVTKTWRQMGFDLDEPKALTAPNGIDWFKKQPAAQQQRLLGKTRFEAWKAGKYPPSQWAVLKQNPGWRPSWDVGKPGGPSRTPFKFPDPIVPKTPTPVAVAPLRTPLDKRMASIPRTDGGRVKMNSANPKYYSGGDEYRTNCYNASMTAEMRHRGYDVVALPSKDISRGMMDMDMAAHFRDASGGTRQFSKLVPVDPIQGERKTQTLRRAVADQPEGARGLMTVRWKTGGSHVCNYEIKNGRLEILDYQNWDTGNGYPEMARNGLKFLRTDDLDFVGDPAKVFDWKKG